MKREAAFMAKSSNTAIATAKIFALSHPVSIAIAVGGLSGIVSYYAFTKIFKKKEAVVETKETEKVSS